MTFQLTTRGVADGPEVMDGADLVLMVLDDTYVFEPEHEYEDIESFEATGAAYVRMTADGRADLTDRIWSVWADDPTTCDLSDDARSGVAVLRDTGSELVFVGWSEDPDGPVALYEPSWPDGLWDQPVESIDHLLAQMVTTVAGVSPVGGDVDAEDLAEALSPYIDGGGGGGDGPPDPPTVWETTASYYVDRDRVWLGGYVMVTASGSSGTVDVGTGLPATVDPRVMPTALIDIASGDSLPAYLTVTAGVAKASSGGTTPAGNYLLPLEGMSYRIGEA